MNALKYTLDDIPGRDLLVAAAERVEELSDEFWYCYECDEVWELEDNYHADGQCPFCDSLKTDILTTQDYVNEKDNTLCAD